MISEEQIEDLEYRNEHQRQLIESGQFRAMVSVRPEDVSILIEALRAERAYRRELEDSLETLDSLFQGSDFKGAITIIEEALIKKPEGLE